MKSFTSLFLSQSYQNAWDDYQRSLRRADFPVWDYVILTASNEQQEIVGKRDFSRKEVKIL